MEGTIEYNLTPEQEAMFVTKLINELVKRGIVDASDWSYYHGDGTDDAFEFLYESIKGYKEGHYQE